MFPRGATSIDTSGYHTCPKKPVKRVSFARLGTLRTYRNKGVKNTKILKKGIYFARKATCLGSNLRMYFFNCANTTCLGSDLSEVWEVLFPILVKGMDSHANTC